MKLIPVWTSYGKNDTCVFYDFINLTQVHNFIDYAQDIFTFGQLSVGTVSFTGV